jgi:hypothetical protein
MDFPWIPLLFNLALLGVIVFVCHTLNANTGKLIWNGALLFFILSFLAMCLDFTLTMVFASASFHDRTQYESVATRSAWGERFFVYFIPCVVAALLALRFRRLQHRAQARVGDDADATVVRDAPEMAQTSPKPEAKLPLTAAHE